MSEPEILIRREAVRFLNDRGYRITLSVFEKICAPSINQGPPSAGRWGNREVYRPDDLLMWARNRLRRPEQQTAA
jgi:hypothetical protein